MEYANQFRGKAREGGGTIRVPGVPSNGTSEVQTLTQTGSPTGGTFKLSFKGRRTATIAYNASAATIVAALEALYVIGAGGVTATGGPLNTTPVVITFAGALAKKAVPLLVLAVNSLTGGTSPTVGIVETTPGVDATMRGAPKGTVVVNESTGIAYQNTGTANAPTWSQIEGTGGVGTADVADSAVTKAKAAVFFSTEQTGTGSSQNVAHGLGAIPAGVLVVPTEHPGTPDTGAFDIAEGTHTTTNVVVTVTANVKFKVFAWA